MDQQTQMLNLLRVISGQLHSLLVMQLAVDRHGKGYHQVEEGERIAVEDSAAGIAAHYARHLTPEAVAQMIQGLKPPTVQ